MAVSDIEAFLDGVRKQLKADRDRIKDYLSAGRCATLSEYHKCVAQVEMTLIFEEYLKKELRKWN